MYQLIDIVFWPLLIIIVVGGILYQIYKKPLEKYVKEEERKLEKKKVRDTQAKRGKCNLTVEEINFLERHRKGREG